MERSVLRDLGRLTAYLKENGFAEIENGVGGLETAFRASITFNNWTNISDGPTIAVICEYDALPGPHRTDSPFAFTEVDDSLGYFYPL